MLRHLLPRALCLAAVLVRPGAAQEVVRVPDEPACPCELRVTRTGTLSDPDGRAGLARPLTVERAPDGHLLVVPLDRQGDLLQFGPDGVFVRRIGRPGRGPREFGAILGLAPGPADSTYVLDAGNRRLVVLGPDLELVRSRSLPVVGNGFGVTDDGSVVVLTALPRGGGVPRDRLTLLDRDLVPIRTFMPGVAPTFPAEIRAARRRIGVAQDGAIVVGHVDRYELEIWNVGGTHERTLVRSPSWFPGELEPTDRGARDPAGPAPHMDPAPRIGPDGRIWTVSWIAGDDGGEAPGEGSDDFDAMIESVDPVAGRVIASTRLDEAVRLISNDGWAAAYREDGAGRPFIDVYRLEVVEAGGGDR